MTTYSLNIFFVIQKKSTSKFNIGGDPVVDQHPIQGAVETVLVTSSYGNWRYM